MKRLLALLLITAVAIAGCGESPWRTHDITGLMPELSFTLTGENGERLTAERFRGKVTLVYFGFTHCRAACPITMGVLSHALQRLGDQAEDVRVLFVSVDPQRDDPERLRAYTRHFGPRFVGATGSRAQLDALAKRYRVSYGYGEADKTGHYKVFHSNGVFVFDRRGEARLLMRAEDGVAAMVADLRRLLAGGDTPAG